MRKASRIARQQGLGRPVRTWRQAFPLWFHLLFVAMIVTIVGAVGLNQDLGIGTKAAGASVPLLTLVVIWWLICDVRMVVCEGGLLIGRFFPLLTPYAIPYRAIEPRGVTCVSNVGRLPSVTGRSYGSTLFHFPQSGRGIVIDGPLPARARVRGGAVSQVLDTGADTVRGGKLWAFAYRGSPEQLVATLQQGMASQRIPYAQMLPQAALPERTLGPSGTGGTGINGLAR